MILTIVKTDSNRAIATFLQYLLIKQCIVTSVCKLRRLTRRKNTEHVFFVDW